MWLNDLYHALNPVAVQLGPIVIRWYGLAYLAGFLLGGVAIWRTSRRWGLDLTPDDVMSVVVSIAVGIIVGARLGYVLFY